MPSGETVYSHPGPALCAVRAITCCGRRPCAPVSSPAPRRSTFFPICVPYLFLIAFVVHIYLFLTRLLRTRMAQRIDNLVEPSQSHLLLYTSTMHIHVALVLLYPSPISLTLTYFPRPSHSHGCVLLMVCGNTCTRLSLLRALHSCTLHPHLFPQTHSLTVIRHYFYHHDYPTPFLRYLCPAEPISVYDFTVFFRTAWIRFILPQLPSRGSRLERKHHAMLEVWMHDCLRGIYYFTIDVLCNFDEYTVGRRSAHCALGSL